MEPDTGQSAPPRINPGAFSRAIVETEAGEIEARLSRYGNWMIHVRPPGAAEWRFVGGGDMESGRLVSNQVAAVEDTVAFGPLTIQRAARRTLVHGSIVEVSKKEFGLLLTLAGDPYRVFSKAELMKLVWGWEGTGRTRTVDSHASRLRRKLTAAGAGGFIINCWGHGYRLAEPFDFNPPAATAALTAPAGRAAEEVEHAAAS